MTSHASSDISVKSMPMPTGQQSLSPSSVPFAVYSSKLSLSKSFEDHTEVLIIGLHSVASTYNTSSCRNGNVCCKSEAPPPYVRSGIVAKVKSPHLE